MQRFLLVAFFAMGLAGCASTSTVRVLNPDRYAANESQFSNQATIYMFRTNGRSGEIWSFPVTLDGKDIGSIRREQYIMFPASAGHHVIGITCPSVCNLFSFLADLDISAGKSYYFMIDPDVTFNYGTVTTSSHFAQIDKPFAERLMKEYELSKNK